MHRFAVRAGLLIAVLVATYASSVYTFPDFAAIAARRARAQEPVATVVVPPAATTPTATSTWTATAIAPSPSPTPAPTPTAVTTDPVLLPLSPPTATNTVAPSTTAIPPPPFETPVPAPPPLPTPDVDLPMVSDRNDPPGAISSAVIAAKIGGNESTADGRIDLYFPPGSVADDAVAVVETLGSGDQPLASHRMLGEWRFSAATVSDGSPIATFGQPVTLLFRASDEDLRGVNPASLQLWTLNETAGQWEPVSSSSDGATPQLVAKLPHFSIYGISGDPSKQITPFSDVATTDLHAGASSLSIPIPVPPGSGGLAPDLTLRYDSSIPNGMHNDNSVGSWVGIGWSFTSGSISFDDSTGYWFLQSPAGGGRILPTDSSFAVFRGEVDDFLRIEVLTDAGLPTNASVCQGQGQLCYWRVTDKKGTQYLFGTSDPASPGYQGSFRRFLFRWVYNPATGLYNLAQRRTYQWDLASTTDVTGNQISYHYVQYSGMGSSISEAVLQSVTWGGGHNVVTFDVGTGADYADGNVGCIGLYAIPANSGAARLDNPRNVYGCLPCPNLWAPEIMPVRALKRVTVNIDTQPLRQYDFTYASTSSSYTSVPYWPNDCPDHQKAGVMILTSLIEKGAGAGAPILRTSEFKYDKYTTLQVPITQQGMPSYPFSWPLLTEWRNGFGGKVTFDYGPYGSASSCWMSDAVISKVVSFGLGEPDVKTTYAYDASLGPDSIHPYPCGDVRPNPERFLGFGRVDETVDPLGPAPVKTTHCYNTGRSASELIMTGRERETWVWGPGGIEAGSTPCAQPLGTATGDLWGHSVYVWNYLQTPNTSSVPYPYFVFLDRKDEYLRSGQGHTGTDYTYDCQAMPSSCYGLLTLTHAEGDPASSNDDTWTSTPYTVNTTNWVFVPEYEGVTDLDPANPAATTLRRRNFYYDGHGQYATAPARGLLTATSTLLTSSLTSNTYLTYYANGNPHSVSVPTSTAPSANVNEYGAIPAGLLFSETQYESTYNVFPSQQMNALGQTTLYANNDLLHAVILGSVVSETDPSGHVTSSQFDLFGRVSKVWDNLDSQGSPTKSFSYGWTTLPNSTTVNERTGASSTRQSVSCMDGFGREVEHREQYSGNTFNSVRTDYDARGLKVAQTNPVSDGTVANCPPTLAAVGSRDRTVFTYDPLGAATTTTHAIANQLTPSCATSGAITYPQPCTQVDSNGLVTTTTDGLGHRTIQTRNLGQRKLTVEEDKGTGQTGDPYWAYATTAYTYDLLGQLTTVQDAAGITDQTRNTTTLTYDLGGRKTSMHDPDMGHWEYAYDVAGNLTSQWDAHGIETTMTYDAVNRLKTKAHSNGNPGVTYTYDAYDTATGAPACARRHDGEGHAGEDDGRRRRGIPLLRQTRPRGVDAPHGRRRRAVRHPANVRRAESACVYRLPRRRRRRIQRDAAGQHHGPLVGRRRGRHGVRGPNAGQRRRAGALRRPRQPVARERRNHELHL